MIINAIEKPVRSLFKIQTNMEHHRIYMAGRNVVSKHSCNESLTQASPGMVRVVESPGLIEGPGPMRLVNVRGLPSLHVAPGRLSLWSQALPIIAINSPKPLCMN